jgi:anti-sigma factor RsiW
VDSHFDKHLDAEALRSLVPWDETAADAPREIPAQALAEAARHLQYCADCARKVADYRSFVERMSGSVVASSTMAGADCPRDVDWYEVAAGLWPELKAQQLIAHAALCDHCGPLLRAAASLDADPTADEERFLATLAAPTRPASPRDSSTRDVQVRRPFWTFTKWAIPAAIAVMVALIVLMPQTPLSGSSYAEIATSTHEQHLQGALPLDFRSESQQQLNEWLKVNLQFPLALPATPDVPGQNRPYRLQGARLVEVRGKPAVYISYVSQNDPVSLLVTPDSVAHASGGVTVDYKKVSFHYRMVAGYKVVTWSLKGRTYALVSHESNTTQRSCMVCHSAMGDRDLTQTPTPLAERIAKPAF